jgi:hypothetical protein
MNKEFWNVFIPTCIWFCIICVCSAIIFPLPEGQKLFDARTLIIVSILLNILIEVKQIRKG